MPWANGRGITHEVMASPNSEDWDWRLSIAEVSEDGPFSVLPGVDRILVVATGNGITLNTAGVSHTLKRFDKLHFDGQQETIGELRNGPIYDVNLMVKRDRNVGAPNVEIKLLDRNEAIELDDVPNFVGLVVLEGAVTIATSGSGFPFNPIKTRASRLDAVLTETPPKDKLTTLHAAAASVVAIVSFE
jgi:environmental stress-induced protein Ves